MGDGGVACVPLQQHNIMEKLCGGKNGQGFNSKSLKIGEGETKKKKKVKANREFVKVELEKSDLELGRLVKSGCEVENGEICADEVQKEEVEEGELGTLRWTDVEVENGEFVPDKLLRSEVENGEIDGENGRKGLMDKGEFLPGRWRKGDVDKRRENGKADLRTWRGVRDDIDKGEVISDRWPKGEVMKDDYSCKTHNRYDPGLEKGWSFENERTPSGKYTVDDGCRRKEFNKSGSQHDKSFFRWEIGHERNLRICSKIVDEEGSHKNEYNNGKSYGRDYSAGKRLRQHGIDSDNSERRKQHGEYSDCGSKSRRLPDDSNSHPSHSEHYYRHSVERSYRSTSSRISSSDKYSSRHYESSLTSRVVYDKHGSSPRNSERSPRDRPRYYDNNDRSPVCCEKSPYDCDRSPYGYCREKTPYGREKTPYGREKTPYGRKKSPSGRRKSPYNRKRSPYDRSRHNRRRSPIHADWSPHDRSQHHDHDRRTPNYLDRSPLNQYKSSGYPDANRKNGPAEKLHSLSGNKGQEDSLKQRDSVGRVSLCSVKESQDRSNVPNVNGLLDKGASCLSPKEVYSQSPINCKEYPCVDGVPPKELDSMEEDMDICDTPPHSLLAADLTPGKWVYLDYSGVECGPSKLCNLKELAGQGLLMSDHFIKHLDSDRWVTVEKAASPMVNVNFSHIVLDSITQLVNPPEAPGNILADSGDMCQSGIQSSEELQVKLPQKMLPGDSAEDLHINERVSTLLEAFAVVPGKELEIVGEVLNMTFEDAVCDKWGSYEGFNWHQASIGAQFDKKSDPSLYSDMELKEAAEFGLNDGDFFSGQWSCKGGDWMRNDEAAQDRLSRKKVVLNDGFSLCQMPKSGYEDPRWNHTEELYYPSQSKRLDLPSWTFTWPDESTDINGMSRSSQIKPAVVRGAKGTLLPVVRINACVVKDPATSLHGSFVSEPRVTGRAKDKYSSRSARSHVASIDSKKAYGESDSYSKTLKDHESKVSWKRLTSNNILKERLCTVDDLQTQLGDWYYLDGAGHEHGPLSFSELQALVNQGIIPKYSSVFRKFDKVWIPVTSASETSVNTPQAKNRTPTVPPSHSQGILHSESKSNSDSFHNMHPQFIGYTRGKLHELVMKLYKSREFAAAINEVLDPWINAKQPKKETETHLNWKSEGDARSGKRPRLLGENESDCEIEEEIFAVQKDEATFEVLCGDTTFSKEAGVCSETETGSWGLLDGHVLARVFHYLKSDMISLVLASLTCKHWRAAVRFYKDISRHIDLSYFGFKCTDSIIWNIINGYNKEKINSLVLTGCTNITSGMLEEILGSFPHISCIDIRGCSQFGELAARILTVNWFKGVSSRGTREEAHSKTRILKPIADKTMIVSKPKVIDEFSEMKDYFESVEKRDAGNQTFRTSFYKRSKLFDARRSSSISSRDARIRRWAIKKSEIGYKRLGDFLASGLKEIMRENTFEFFVPKVAEIEDKMKNGYYISHGLRSVKEDISRICRDAIKVKNHGDAKNMNRIITLFIQLATDLEGSYKSSHDKDDIIRSWKDDSSGSKYKNKISKLNDKKYMSRSNVEYASDREIRRRLSKFNRKSLGSGSETSDELDRSSEDDKSHSESTASESESDLGFRSESRIREARGNEYFMSNWAFDSMTEDRGWGARMTKEGLVPPVTRKYEVIDHYVIVVDEDDVRQKMSVSLPEDYIEKFDVQKNSNESDMELPEVKEYKPRKQPGDEVIEQEVYGIDPYTHNLLFYSMPEEFDWPQEEKHKFVEDVLLRTLNRLARRFTGSGSTPMKYPLRPVIEEIEKTAASEGDIRTIRMCKSMLRAIDCHPDDNYVAYRKGLGVVCNKEGGFEEDDFVVEFLGEVYPAWKWFEKQDGIRSLQKNSADPAPEFYNIYLERPKGDADGYDLVVVDAMHKANYASRICHSCRPNCEAKVTAVDGQYQIGVYSVCKIQYGEEITFDYNSVTESKEEYEASVCLCGSQGCRGSYLNLTGEGAFQKVLKECHGLLDRHQLMLEACELNFVSEDDYVDLGKAGLGNSLLGGLPDWLVAYSARLVRFINLERKKLPDEILEYNLEERRKYFSDIDPEVDRSDAEVQAEGVYNQRLQNLALTLDKVRYVMKCIYGEPKRAPPPLEKLGPEDMVDFVWKGEGSLVQELLQCISPHLNDDMLNDLKSKIQVHDPSGSGNVQKQIRKSLLWLRDEVRNLPCTYKCRHDAAADLIHIYAYTKSFFRIREYKAVTSPPVHISPLDLGPKYADKLGNGIQEYCKTYGENYCLGQLIFWHIQTNAEPDCTLDTASRGCLSLPEIGSFYAKVQKPSRQRVYGPRTLKFMLARMEKQPQRPWPKDKIWSFKASPKIFGSPMLDAVLSKSPLDADMVHWLKNRPALYQANWDH